MGLVVKFGDSFSRKDLFLLEEYVRKVTEVGE